ncbi:MAG: MBL fold metallo-hydrolase [Azospirillum brasilense]|nr:MAG: MBL fold metallo-hydrolase [Azospirillum brasilense]
MPTSPAVRAFHHAPTGSVAYVVSDPGTGRCAVIDPVLGFDRRSGRVDTEFAEAMAGHLRKEGLKAEWVLDTHPHADHLSAVAYLGGRLGARTATGRDVTLVQDIWAEQYGLPDLRSSTYWDRLLSPGDRLELGGTAIEVMSSPGHTAASVTLVIGDAAFIHDTLFMPDLGTARADFPGGDARALYDSIQAILALPEGTRLFTGHDYPPEGQSPSWESSITQQRATNIHLCGNPCAAAFVAMRQERDRTLPLPELMLLALQVNLRGGRLPEPEANGVSCLRLPLNLFPADPAPEPSHGDRELAKGEAR